MFKVPPKTPVLENVDETPHPRAFPIYVKDLWEVSYPRRSIEYMPTLGWFGG